VLASAALFSAQVSADERPAAARDRELASQQKILENKLTLIQRMLEGPTAQRVHAADNSAALERLNAAQALKIIEAATNNLVQALRKTGMYLP